MDIFEKRGIKIPNAVLIKEATTTETDDEVIDFLQQYGSILKSECIDEPDSAFHNSIVAEYNSGAALAALRPILPYTYKCNDAETTYKILDLSTVCAHEVGKLQTQNYLSELQKVAKLTGQDFAVVLNGVMSLLGQSVTQLNPTASDDESPSEDDEKPPPPAATVGLQVSPLLPAATFGPPVGLAGSDQNTKPQPRVQPAPTAQHASRTALPAMSHANLDPPEVRYVVEHIVKNDDSSLHFTQRLRAFSGRSPRPQTESDYDTWRSGVELLLKDPAMSDLQRSRKIFDSLLPPAADMVKHLRPDTQPTVYLQTLDSAYGTVQDGDELYAKFMDTFQDAGEKPSNYLQRLQVALNQAVKRGGVLNKDFGRHLLTQFCRGCWDNSLITELQLKQRKYNPPSFAEFLLLLRTEEDREAAKAIRMKQHLGSSRSRVATHAQYAYTDSAEKGEIAALTNTTQQLAQQLADIQKQLVALTAAQSSLSSSQSAAFKSTPGRKLGEGQRAGKPPKNPSSVPKAGYCYRCGEDGHIKTHCDNPPNSALVAAKRKQFTEKQQRWQKSNPTSRHSLN